MPQREIRRDQIQPDMGRLLDHIGGIDIAGEDFHRLPGADLPQQEGGGTLRIDIPQQGLAGAGRLRPD
jgi:hypothetical protein